MVSGNENNAVRVLPDRLADGVVSSALWDAVRTWSPKGLPPCSVTVKGTLRRSARPLDRTGTLWHPHLEWRLENTAYRGNPYDLMASVTFTHQESGSKHLTWMYYDGAGAWRFRFTGTQTGVWTFTTRSHARI
jgi:hypothetical protein